MHCGHSGRRVPGHARGTLNPGPVAVCHIVRAAQALRLTRQTANPGSPPYPGKLMELGSANMTQRSWPWPRPWLKKQYTALHIR